MKYIARYVLGGCLCLSALFLGCSDSDSNNTSSLVINKFYPTEGGIGTEVLITGKNFSNNRENVKVSVGGKELIVLDCNDTGIMVVVPKRLGSGPLQVTVGDKEALSVEDFSYIYSAAVTTIAGTGKPGYMDGEGTDAQFKLMDEDRPWRKGSICVDSEGNVYVGDVGNFCLRKITPDGIVTTLAGRLGGEDHVDGIGAEARFKDIYGMDCDASDNIYLTDVSQWTLRKVTPEGEVTTIESTPIAPWGIAVDKRNGTIYISNAEGEGIWQKKTGESFKQIVPGASIGGLTIDGEGNLFATEFNNHLIVKYSADKWTRTVVAGSSSGYEDGEAVVAKFANPWGLVVDNIGDLYIAGNGIWDGGNNPDQSIRMVDVEKGMVRTVAGSATAGYQDANGSFASFSAPLDIAMAPDGVMYVFDRRNHAIRKIVYE